MPRLWILSDLHNECDPTGRRKLVAPDFDVLVAAGDIHESDVVACVEAVARLAGGRPSVMVLGNHDLYGMPIERACAVARRHAEAAGVRFLERGFADVEGLRFAGGTLWDDIRTSFELPNGARPDLTNIMSGIEPDFFAPPPFRAYGEPVSVEEGGRTRQATFADIARRHDTTLRVIRESGADVVVTHYPPSARDLEYAGGAGTWIHGHVHACERRTENGIDVILNAGQSRLFAERMVVEVEPARTPAP